MIKHSGPNSVTLVGKGNGKFDSGTWTQLPNGRLKELLTAPYKDIDSLIDAGASKGAIACPFGPKGVGQPYWSIDSGGFSILVVPADNNVPWAVRVACSYSAAD